MLEISAGVFVGFVSARVRDLMWERVVELAKDGKAIMVYSTRGEQRLAFRVHRHQWQPVDVDGVTLMLRPAEGKQPHRPSTRSGWSKAAKYRMATKRKRA